MTESQNDIHKLAAQYMDLWQKQMTSQKSEKMVEDTLKSFNSLNEEAGEIMKSFDSPEKVQNWMSQWAEAWKAQLENGDNPIKQFADMGASWAQTSGSAPFNPFNYMDELQKRVTALEERVAELESKSKG